MHVVFDITRVCLVSTYSISSTSLVWRAVLQWQSPHIEGSAPKHYDNHQIVATSCHCAWNSFHKETSEVALLKRRWWVNLRRSKPFRSYFCVLSYVLFIFVRKLIKRVGNSCTKSFSHQPDQQKHCVFLINLYIDRCISSVGACTESHLKFCCLQHKQNISRCIWPLSHKSQSPPTLPALHSLAKIPAILQHPPASKQEADQGNPQSPKHVCMYILYFIYIYINGTYSILIFGTKNWWTCEFLRHLSSTHPSLQRVLVEDEISRMQSNVFDHTSWTPLHCMSKEQSNNKHLRNHFKRNRRQLTCHL